MLKSLLKKSRDLQRFNDWWKISRRKGKRGALVQAYLAAPGEKKLHLGCGDNFLPGWLNTDQSTHDPRLVYVDVTEPFPLPADSFDYVMAEHIIEHIARRDAEKMLMECHRVLRPGGVLRIGTPDLPKYLALYAGSPTEIERECLREIFDSWIFPGFHKAGNYAPQPGDYSPIYMVNDIFMNYEHRFLYDFALLRQMCLAAGFASCERRVAGVSELPALHGVETHVDRVNAYLTVTLEARKAGRPA